MTTAVPVLANRVLPTSKTAGAAAVVGFAAITALAAQVSFRIPPIEVPFTLQTMAVLMTGGVLGARRGALSQLLYLVAGALGLPGFAERSSGMDTFAGPTAGYLVGFVVAAYLVGRLAERHHDRKVLSAFAAFLLGSLVIYGFGTIGLMATRDLDFWGAVAVGVVPFVFWDVLKALAAGIIMPSAWRLTGDKHPKPSP